MAKFKPELIVLQNHPHTKFGVMMVEVDDCPLCKTIMVANPIHSNTHSGHRPATFPTYWELNFEAQLKEAGWIEQSTSLVDDHYVCVDCVKAGKLDFLCVLCEKRLTTNQEEERFGDPPEYLCKGCYSSIPAQLWCEKVKELCDKHQYDFTG